MNRATPLSRRSLGIVALAVGTTGISSDTVQAQPIESLQLLGELPEVPVNSGIAVYRLVLRTGETWDQQYPGPVSVTVESGTMSVPSFGEKHLQGAGGYGPEGCDSHLPNTSTSFDCGQGFYAETGDFGTISNQTKADLSILILMARHFGPTSEDNAPATPNAVVSDLGRQL